MKEYSDPNFTGENIMVGGGRTIICEKCRAINLPFADMQIKNAWQKDGFNQYIFECTRCGKDNEFGLRIQAIDEK